MDEPFSHEPASAEPPRGAEEADRASALRALRNLEATKARLERSAAQDAAEARGKLASEVFPVLDNLDRTILAAEATSDRALLDGVRMVRAQLETALQRFGVERVEALGERFDPGRHEAISMVSVVDPRLHGVVTAQLEQGYQHEGKLLRAAKVSVGRLVSPPPPRLF
jgi:molecular chaperone GrpE